LSQNDPTDVRTEFFHTLYGSALNVLANRVASDRDSDKRTPLFLISSPEASHGVKAAAEKGKLGAVRNRLGKQRLLRRRATVRGPEANMPGVVREKPKQFRQLIADSLPPGGVLQLDH
jgi:hypothetical protein